MLSEMQLRDPGSWHAFYRPLWLAAALVNSCYSYFWDVERDWEIQFFSAAGAGSLILNTPSQSIQGMLRPLGGMHSSNMQPLVGVE